MDRYRKLSSMRDLLAAPVGAKTCQRIRNKMKEKRAIVTNDDFWKAHSCIWHLGNCWKGRVIGRMGSDMKEISSGNLRIKDIETKMKA